MKYHLMFPTSDSPNCDDPYNLNRFLQAQEVNYEQAFSEIRAGYKRTHWMWYVFPQLEGLASSAKSHFYSIKSLEEARAYLAHPILGLRLIACAEAMLHIEDKSALEVLGSPDDMKLKSCATLFALVSPPGSVFEHLIEKYFQGVCDQTMELLGTHGTSQHEPTVENGECETESIETIDGSA